MQIVFPHLGIGNSNDAYNTLYTGFNQIVTMVLDCTSDMPTKKWNRVKMKLRKVGLEDMTKAKLMKAIDFIHDHRKLNETVLVVGKDTKRANAVVIAYLAAKKGLTLEQCLEKLAITEADVESVEILKKFIAALPRVGVATATVKAVASAPIV